ncbi:conserved hypothetical protein [Ixodes scapularis]|uniref:CD109 antigen n=1 Tax=Ixodes scapularis TaxID=6945 RepID=B7PCZ6_IXOSC|nr:conserved hypothetical protein [Ixodes scapularis]|eukprot:XP_002410473.1 conserved hypothetical protein [Ixodes scapularis]
MRQVPQSAKPGKYKFRVEGNVNGVLGGTGFIQERDVEFQPQFLTILIQTNQFVYNYDQSIKARIVLLTTELKPYTEPVDVWMLLLLQDSRGIVMKRWVSQYPYLGFVKINFELPHDFAVGFWTLKVVALSQVEEKKILLERWYTERYDVYVTIPPFVLDSDEYYEGDVSANFTTVNPVYGNATIRLYFQAGYQFKFPMSDLKDLAAPHSLDKCEIEVKAAVGERFLDIIVHGYARSRIINSSLSLKILGVKPLVFKPGMTFTIYVAVTYHDLVKLPEEKLKESNITLSFTGQGGGGGLNDIETPPNEKGMATVEITPPEGTEKIVIRVNTNQYIVPSYKVKNCHSSCCIHFIALQAKYRDKEDVVETEALAVAQLSPGKKFIQISTSTSNGVAGEYAIFHVRTNFYIKFFHYLVISKGTVLQAGVQKAYGLLQTITSFSVPLSPEMAPAIKVMVYQISGNGDLTADAVIVPVRGINRGNFYLWKNLKQDRSNNLIELVPTYTTETIAGLNGLDSDLVAVQGKNDLTPTSVIESFYRMEDHWGSHIRAIWRDRDGKPDEAEYFVTPSFAPDVNKTFIFSGLIVATNLNVTTLPSMFRFCTPAYCFERMFRFLVPFMLSLDEQTFYDGEQDDLEDKPLFEFFLYRTNRFNNFFDATGSNFAWHHVKTGNLKDIYTPCIVPKPPTNYMFNAIAVSRKYGFAIIDKPIYHNSMRPFYMTYEAPSTAVIGEQIGIRVVLFNYQSYLIQAELRVLGSDDYRFVQVGPLGRVGAYNPVTTKGEIQHIVYIQPYQHIIIHVPIVSVKIGDVEVNLVATTQVAREEATISITFLPDGVPLRMHTSLLMDLRAQAYNLKFLDLNVTEDPIIPFESQYRRYLFGSPAAHVSVIGDVVGTPLEGNVEPEDFGFSAATKSGEHAMFGFAYNVLRLTYLRLTDQLTRDIAKPIFEKLNKAYVYQSSYFKNGAFTMFKRQPSVWLTAFSIRMYELALFPDWENFIFIDPRLISQGVTFLLSHQQPNGAFYETTKHPWNRRMNEKVLGRDGRYLNRNVTLTAQVVLALSKVTLTGDIRQQATTARAAAVKYLERQLAQLKDAYAISITTYALLEAGSNEAEYGYNLLESIKRDAEGAIYWSSVPIPPPVIISQSQRPFLMPRFPHPDDSLAVEATSYALIIYLKQGGLFQDQIVRWLNRMRTTDYGFIGTQARDTIAALEALTQYSFRTHVRGITEMKVTVESSSNPGFPSTLQISKNDLARRKVFDVQPNVWGHCDVLAKGAGLSVIQMDVSYNVDRDFLLVPPAYEAFELTLQPHFSGRNRSHINIKSCVRWTLTNMSEASGAAVLELAIPTGYLNYRPTLDAYVKSRVVPRLRMAKVAPRTAVFMFEYLTNEWSCVDFLIQRWYPVANSTRYLKAKVYEYNTPENYKETIWENYDLFVLSICEVCGSYQCPYCPYFSSASSISLSWVLMFSTALLCQELYRKVTQ